jgi:hypothetical protein
MKSSTITEAFTVAPCCIAPLPSATATSSAVVPLTCAFHSCGSVTARSLGLSWSPTWQARYLLTRAM